MSNPLTKCEFFENGDATLLARIEFDGEVADQSDIASVTCNVYDINGPTPSTPVISPTLAVSAVVFNSLQGVGQSDPRWTVDAIGYNFLHNLPATAFPTAKHNYHVIYKFTSSSGKVAFAIFDGTTLVTDY